MRLNPQTGEITLTSGLVLSPKLSRFEFLSSPDGLGSQEVLLNGLRRAHRLNQQQGKFIVWVFFESDRLDLAQFSSVDPGLEDSRMKSSSEDELVCKRYHEAWLNEHGLSTDVSYLWGTVSWVFDRRNREGYVQFRYRGA